MQSYKNIFKCCSLIYSVFKKTPSKLSLATCLFHGTIMARLVSIGMNAVTLPNFDRSKKAERNFRHDYIM